MYQLTELICGDICRLNNYTINGASQITWGTINAVGHIVSTTENIVATTRNITVSSGTITGNTQPHAIH